MSAVGVAAESERTKLPQAAPIRWNPLTRIVFRFSFLYFGLFCLLYPQLLSTLAAWLVNGWSPADASVWQTRMLRPLLDWVGWHVFGVPVPPVSTAGTGDQMIFWMLLFCILVTSVAGTAVWTLLDWRRPEYRRLSGWFLLFVRLCVAGQLMSYGLGKLIPTQMPVPGLRTLLTPYGEFTPMAVLWNQVGISQHYEVLLGAAEVLGAVLLFIPRTAILGAMLGLVDMAMVFVMDMSFDVAVRILCGHLMLMSAMLLAPEARRLLSVLLLNRPTTVSTSPYPFHTRRSRWIAVAAQVALGAWVASSIAVMSVHYWRLDHAPHSPVYGIWSVTQFSQDGRDVLPLTTDGTRWRRVVFDDPSTATYQRMNDTLVDVQCALDSAAHRIELTTADTNKQLATLRYDRESPDRMRLTGELAGQPVTMTLERVDPDSYPLRSTKFEWIQESPRWYTLTGPA